MKCRQGRTEVAGGQSEKLRIDLPSNLVASLRWTETGVGAENEIISLITPRE